MSEWIVVIDRAQARFFESETPARRAEFVRRLKNPLGREKNRAMNTDKPGSDRMKIGKSVIGHSMSGEKDQHEDAAVQFVRTVGRTIVAGLQTGGFKRLIIYADPHISGLVGEVLGRRHLTVPIIWRHKNFSKMSDLEVAKIIRSDGDRQEHEKRA
ncbi:MAG: host attachment protein [Bdellovibrionia bacterium]